jgi:hypothetical protein
LEGDRGALVFFQQQHFEAVVEDKLLDRFGVSKS